MSEVLKKAGEILSQPLSGAELDTLVALVERGPLWDGDVPSKSGRDGLLERGLAAKVVVNACDGFQAATYRGREVYCAHFKGDTIAEAMANRKYHRLLRRVSNHD